MGEVNRSLDTRIGREVAIKTMRAEEGLGEGPASRFLREARVQALLEHPAIVPVYDIGRDRSSPVSHYTAPFEFTGRLLKVTVDMHDDQKLDKGERTPGATRGEV